MKITLKKRVFALLLAMLMVIPVVPGIAIEASAAGALSTINGLTATWTDASNKNGKASWTAGGTSITGTATGYVKYIGLAVTTDLTLKNTSGDEATLSFDYTLTGGGSVSGVSGGSYKAVLANNGSVKITLKSPKGAATNTLAITNLSLISTSVGNVTTTFKPATSGGSYTVAVGTGSDESVNSTVEKTDIAGTQYNLKAVPASGYMFFGWYNEITNTYYNYDETTSIKPAENMTIVPHFISSNIAIFDVGGVKFSDLTAAGEYAVANSVKTMVLLNNGIVSGSHTIPKNVTLLIPCSENHNVVGEKPATTATWTTPSAYVTLTLAAGTNITVDGAIEVGATIRYCSGGNIYGNVPTGKYGAIYMNSGSKVTLNSGAKLFAWGYVFGNGSVIANSDASVYECMQITDFYGGGELIKMEHMFPFSQYYIQNIEVPLTLHYGAKEYVYVKLVIAENEMPATVPFIGSGSDSMFRMGSGSSVIKDYDASTDRLILDVYGNTSLQSVSMEPDLSDMSIDKQLMISGLLQSYLGSTTINSSNYMLCLNSNMTINVHSGITTISQELSALPGVEVYVDNGATLSIASGNSSKTTVSEASEGKNVYLYNNDQWGSYVYKSKKLIPAVYSPTANRYKRTENDLKDVILDINGTVITDGYLYSTVGIDVMVDGDEEIVLFVGGASIISSEKTGLFVMNNGAGSEMEVFNLDGTGATETTIFTASAQLKNGDGTYLDTTGAGHDTTFNYCPTHDCWYTGKCEACASAPTMHNITWNYGTGTYTDEFAEGETPVFNNDNYINVPKGHSLVYSPAIVPVEAPATYNVSVNPCVDNNKDHFCDYGCGNKSNCSDTNFDHICEYCEKAFYECEDKNNDCICDFIGCKKQLAHKYSKVVTAPTCTAKGYTTYTCACGDTYKADYVDATGHTYTSKVTTAATHLTEGVMTYTCSCGDTYTETIAKLAEHTYKSVVTDPTCTEAGYTTYTCACGDTYTDDEVKALGHTDGEEVRENNVAPTCTADGSYDTVVYCSVCKDELSRETKTVDALKHEYSKVVTDPTCTEAGYTTYTCVRGDHEYTADEVDALGHTDADGDKDHICDVCNTEGVTDCVGGEAVKEEINDATCEVNGSYQEVVYCTECGKELSREDKSTSATGHDWNTATYAWSDDNKSCTATRTCKTDSEHVETKTVDASSKITTPATCTDKGKTTYTAEFDAEWGGTQTIVVEDVAVIAHDYKAVVTAPTCTTAGYTTYTCACGDTYTADEVTALGHTDGDAVTENNVPPTCTATGSYDTVTYCSVCGVETSSVTTTVDALDHGTTKGFTYDDNDDGTHAVICNDCNVTVETVEHKYGDDHKCECEAVETFTVKLTDWNFEEKDFGTLEIPYGAKVFDYLETVEVKDFERDDYYYNGVFSISGDWWYKESPISSTMISEEFTMPGEDITLFAYMYFTGWQYCTDGKWSYVIKDVPQIGWIEVEGEWYYLAPDDNYTALRATGITRASYPTTAINGVPYTPDQETLEYCNNKGIEFKDAESAFFVFDDDGKFNAVTGIVDGNRYALNGMIGWHPGLVEVNGDYYYFIGNVEKGGNTPANGDTYITRANGIEGFKQGDVYNFANGKLSGYNGIVDGKYYVDSKRMDGNGLTAIEVNGETKYIYVRSTGEVVMNANYWIGANNFNIVPGSYDFDENGYMLNIATTDKNGIYNVNGAYYFYEDGVLAYKGLIRYTGTANDGTVYDNDWIYVRSNGQLAANRAYWTTKNESGELESKNYNFDSFGKMITKSGIVEENGNLYYYINGIKQQCLGLIELDGKYYYVRTAGELVRGREYWITNVNDTGVAVKCYYFNENGEMQNPVHVNGETENGIVDGYYYVDGKIAYGAGLVQLEDGSIIYVRSNGQLATGIYWPTTLNGILPAGKYDFGTDGRLVTE